MLIKSFSSGLKKKFLIHKEVTWIISNSGGENRLIILQLVPYTFTGIKMVEMILKELEQKPDNIFCDKDERSFR